MASKVAGAVIGKVGKSKAKQYETQDPYYEVITSANGKTKKQKRALPAGLTPEEQRLLRKVRRRAHYLDKGINLCGFRVGWTFFIALIPVVGDLTDAALGYNLVTKQCKKADLPANLVAKMNLNTILATGVGMIPLAGDIIMAAFKPNSRNALMFEEFLVKRSASGGAGVTAANQQAAAQEVLDQASQGGWSSRTGGNNALGPSAAEAGLVNQQHAAPPALPARP